MSTYKAHREIESADQEDLRPAVLAEKGVSKQSPHTLGLTGQVWALVRRQFQLRIQDKFQLMSCSFTLPPL